MAKIYDTTVSALAPGKRKSERLDNGGSLIIWNKKRAAGGSKEFYFRKILKEGSEINIKIGSYPSMKLVQARKRANELSSQAADTNNIKFQLEEEKRLKVAAEQAAIRERARLDNLGTLQQLCEAYRDRMEAEDRSSYAKVFASLERYVLKPYPHLANQKANLITADDVKHILQAMYDRGITTTLNRTRGDLHAAFNVGLTYDHDITVQRSSPLCFDISSNPVAKIKKIKKFERVLERNLNTEELRIVWGACCQYMNPVYASLLKIMICTGFHPVELLRLSSTDIITDEKAIYMTQTKSSTPNLILLNKYAWEEIQTRLNGPSANNLLFPSRVSNPKSDDYDRASVLSNQVAALRSNLPIESFTPRDIRRTVKTLMGKAGISKTMRDRMQNHTASDVSGKHYDRYDYLPEKKAAMKTWEQWLAKNVIEPGAIESNVISGIFTKA
jgi:integrase